MEDFVKQFKIRIKENKENLIFVCIGSNKIIGDSFGPMVGTKLKNIIGNKKILILGDMQTPLKRVEITKKVKKLSNKKLVIAIDSAIGNSEIIGTVFIKEGTLKIASGINKSEIEIGDISIKAVTTDCVNKLQTTSLELVDKLSDIVSKGIYKSIS